MVKFSNHEVVIMDAKNMEKLIKRVAVAEVYVVYSYGQGSDQEFGAN